jgi:hypothetical protein
MKMILRVFVTLSIMGIQLMVPSLNSAYAIENKSKLPIEQSRYIDRYIDAINTDNLSSFKNLVHPSYLECITPDNSDYYGDLFRRSLQRQIPNDYKVVIDKLTGDSIDKEVAGAEKQGLPYPIRPTHQIQIDFSKSEYSFVTIARKLVLDDGQYYEVSGCPSAEMLDRYRKLKIKKEKERIKTKALFENLKGNLLHELTELLKEGRKIDAWKRYSQETGESIGTAKDVLSHVKLSQ